MPLSKTGVESSFDIVGLRYERGCLLAPTNYPLDEWSDSFGSERLTGALLDGLTHHVNILEMNGDSYYLDQNRKQQGQTAAIP